ncbi:MAG: formate--tetrahydrofolate ligase [Planctomycetaceae bacterium]|jgi:formate--tetrahydrofolate ligase|nr:formate--tetrahydrofolate ligase [Planctomycetaceae bacterium]
MLKYLSDLEIARSAVLQPIEKIAAKLGVDNDLIDSYGRYKAKISLSAADSIEKSSYGKLILVTAITPTPAGEGKTTTSIGLADALNRIGKKTTVCLREPSLGPCFGIKGGAAGGGYAQVVPMEEINLHFTGDFHAITSAHDLLAAVLDNHLHHGNSLGIDPRRIVWGRVLDLNDRALRHVVVGLGGTANSVPHESSFDITVASEVMAIFCLSESIFDLKEKLGQIIVAYAYDGKPVTATDLKCHGAMTALLKDAIRPNLVQTLEGNPAIVHGGPFANIAHGCNSVTATKTALKLSEYTVTEAGFGADLGAEKFLDIKCRKTGLSPNAVVIVATVRALKYHGGIELADLKTPNAAAVKAGFANLGKHIENMRQFGLPVVVAINVFPTDTDEETRTIERLCQQYGVRVALAEHWAKGGAGAENLAKVVVETVETEQANFKTIYSDDLPLLQKIETVAQKIYGADGVVADKKTLTKLKQFETLGFGHFPICIAKTQYSFSADPGLRGRPSGFNVPVRDVKISAGAGFVVALTGEVMTMPGLPKSPAAEHIDINEHGEIVGLF